MLERAIGEPLSAAGVASPALNLAHNPARFTLHPGDVAVAGCDETLETLLGSCVAIVLTDPRRTVGAMCHIVHAARPPVGAGDDTRYAESALEALYRLLRARGIVPALCEAYVYGGGNMFPALVTDGHVGNNNADWALRALARDRVRVLHHDLGGCSYRRVVWRVGTGAPAVSYGPLQP